MWFWFAIASSVFGAIDVILSKKVLHKVSAVVLAWCLFALTIPILIYLSLREGIPALNLFFFMCVFGSSLTYIFSKTISNNILKQNLISKILPLTAFTGIFTYIFGLIFLSETIRPLPLAGLLVVISGAYVLNADQAKEDLLKPFKLLFLKKEIVFFFFAMMLGALTVVLDKSALQNTNPVSPIFTMLMEQIIMSVALGVYMLKREKMTWVSELKNNFGILFLNSLIFLFSGLLIFYAYKDNGSVALIMGVRRLQIFFILLLSLLFFNDKPMKHIWIATVIMVLGILMIKLG